jgi:hypothetical protein
MLSCAVLCCAERLTGSRHSTHRKWAMAAAAARELTVICMQHCAVAEVRGARLGRQTDGLIVPNRRPLRRNSRYHRGSEIQQYEPPASLLQGTIAACTRSPPTSASVHSRHPQRAVSLLDRGPHLFAAQLPLFRRRSGLDAISGTAAAHDVQPQQTSRMHCRDELTSLAGCP